jgi:membrane protein YdbS with pleckstrin-like domain
MEGFYYIFFGVICAIVGGVLWWKQEHKKQLINGWIVTSIVLIILGAFNILVGLEYFLQLRNTESGITPNVKKVTLLEWMFIIGLIFIGSISYTIAAYYHLKLTNWSFLTAFAIALPLILIEYQFSIRGNFAAKHILNLNAIQITLLTMTFYFINSWILNYFFLKHPVIWWRETLAFIAIIIAFLLSTNMNR